MLWTLLPLMGAVAGEVRGKIILEGTPPPEKWVDLSIYTDVTKAYPELISTLTTRHYIVGANKGLANVFVHIKDGMQGKSFPIPTDIPVLDQTNAGFYPYVMGVMTNQPFQIRNSEPYMDTVRAAPKVNQEWVIAQPMTGMVATKSFPLAEVLIRLKCEIHPWEFAFVGVVENPYFAVTDTNGVFKLPSGVPSGKYVLEAIHPKCGALQQEIVVEDGKLLNADFVMKPKPPEKQ